jgi:anti-anti-sigma regulatory factor
LIDAQGARLLEHMVKRLGSANIDVSFSGFSEYVQDLLDRYKLDKVIGKSNIYPTQVLAVRHIYAKAHIGSNEVNCPLELLKPSVAELSLHSDGSYRSAKRWGLKKCRYIAALRYDGPLDLAASEYLEQKVEERIAAMPDLKHVFFAMHRINQIDAHGLEVLRRVVIKLQQADYGVSLSGLSDDVADKLKESDLYDKIGADNIYPTQMVAIENIHGQAHEGGDEEECPLVQVVLEEPAETIPGS